MEGKKVVFEVMLNEKFGMGIKIDGTDEVSAIEMLGILEMLKVEILKDNGNITNK